MTQNQASTSANADEFGGMIRVTLASHPEYLAAALAAISDGMNEALRSAHVQRSISDQAALAAMGLAKGRLTPELRELLIARVVAAIHPQNKCELERGYIDQHVAREASQ